MFLESYCSNCIWFVMRNLLLILLMMAWEIIRVGDYEYFVSDFLAVQFFWFNLNWEKKKKNYLVLVQMVPHFHIRECIPWLCVNLPQKKTQICIFFVYWSEVNFLLNVLIENIISLWCTIFIRWPCRKLASWPFDSCFLLDCGSYWLLVRIVNQVDVGWQIVQQSPHASVLS